MKFKKTILGTLSAAVLTLSLPGNANAAGWPVSDLELIGYLGGTLNGGLGVVELLTSLNSTVMQGNTISKNNALANNDIENIRADQNFERRMRAEHSLDTNACVAPTTASGGGKGAVQSATSGYSNLKSAEERLVSQTPRAEKYQEVLSDQQKIGLCTEADFKTLKTYGCQSLGEYSNNQGTASPILYPPLKDSEVDNIAPMGGLDVAQQKIRNHNIALLVGLETLPPLDTKEQMSTEEGAAYEAKRQQSNMRKSMAIGTMLKTASIENSEVLRADGTAAPQDKKGFIGKFEWNAAENASNPNSADSESSYISPRGMWADVFGDKAKFPEKPSEWDFLTYQVYSKYAATKKGSFQTSVASMNERTILKEIARMDAVSLRLQMLSVQSQRDMNNTLGAILAVLIEKNDVATQESYKRDISVVPIVNSK